MVYNFNYLIKLNVETVLDESTNLKLEVSKKVWINILSGEISNNFQNSGKIDWRVIWIKQNSDHVSADVEEEENFKKLNKCAQIVLDQTIMQISEKILKKTTIDSTKNNSLFQIVQNVQTKINEELRFSMLANKCFGERPELENVKSVEEIADVVFLLIKERLESPIAIDEDEINNMFQLLFDTFLKKESERYAIEEYHPSYVINRLKQAFEQLGIDASMAMTSEGEFGGVNQSFFLIGKNQQKLWVFKPENGEKSAVEGIKSGEGAVREHVACLLNYDRQYMVPYTAYVKIKGMQGSVQAFQPNCEKLGLLRTDSINKPWEKLPSKLFHKLLLFDIRFSNTDRHSGNILCAIDPLPKIYAIDHGGCMTTSINDPLCFEYLSLKQMIMEDFDHETKLMIKNLDPEKDAKIMRTHGIGNKAIEWMHLSTKFLKYAVEVSEGALKEFGFGLSPSDLGVIILKLRSELWTANNVEGLKIYFYDILKCKKHIHDLQKAGNLTEKEVKDYKTIFSKQVQNERQDDVSTRWLDQLFTTIIAPYCKHLTSGKLILDFY